MRNNFLKKAWYLFIQEIYLIKIRRVERAVIQNRINGEDESNNLAHISKLIDKRIDYEL